MSDRVTRIGDVATVVAGGTLWRLLLTGRVKSWLRDFDLYRWRDRFKRDGLTASLRLELRETLTPLVSLREPFR